VELLFAALSVCLTTICWFHHSEAQPKKVRVAIPSYTIAVLSFLAAKTNGYYAVEGLDVELVAMRAPTANVAVLSGSVEFSAVPLTGLTTALRGAPLKVLFSQNDRPQHILFAKADLQNLKALRGKKIAVVGPGAIDDVLLREVFQRQRHGWWERCDDSSNWNCGDPIRCVGQRHGGCGCSYCAVHL
jgi:ABC-type nitrate/sulfonate/bicarbonate transport system substrate-binding protein